MNNWKDEFIKRMYDQIGAPYILGGGQMKVYKGLNNLDSNNNWIGFDCCGGIMFALRETTGINLILRNVPGMMRAPWLFTITKMALEPADLVFVDVPGKDENGKVMYNDNGYPVYGVYNHVMTYIGETDDGNIITTEGEGGDVRINPKSKTKTVFWTLEAFQKLSARIFEDTTRYQYMRINWKWLEIWKKNH